MLDLTPTARVEKVAERPNVLPDGDTAHSTIKQIYSSPFGVTSSCLVGADEFRIKVAWDARPREGGTFLGRKASTPIAHTRHSAAGVSMSSPYLRQG